MSVKDDFYLALSEDLTKKGTQSVLYRYLDEEQEQRTVREEKKAAFARSYQLRIRYYRKRLMEGSITPEEYVKQLFGLLLQKPKFCKQCGKTQEFFENGR